MRKMLRPKRVVDGQRTNPPERLPIWQRYRPWSDPRWDRPTAPILRNRKDCAVENSTGKITDKIDSDSNVQDILNVVLEGGGLHAKRAKMGDGAFGAEMG